MAGHATTQSAKHRAGAGSVQRPTAPGAAKPEAPVAPAPAAPAPVPAPAAAKRGPTRFAPFNLSSSNRTNREEPAEAAPKPAWDSSVGPTDPGKRYNCKLDAPKSAAKSKEARRDVAKSASKAARAEAMANRRA